MSQTRWLRRLVVGATVAVVATAAPLPALAEVAHATGEELSVPVGGASRDVDAFRMIALSWAAPSDGRQATAAPPSLEVRRPGGWETVPLEVTSADAGPDGATVEHAQQVEGRTFTEPVWVGSADGFRVADPLGRSGLTATLIREVVDRVAVASVPTAGAAVAPDGPGVNPRNAWGAAAPKDANGVARSVRFAVIHHTASSNDYSAADVPSILRSIQAFHQQSRGWNDIAYNFLVDKFGGIWEGRAGGIGRPIIGSHALGVNTGSVGVSLIGDFTTAQPSPEALESAAQVVGWKLALHGVDPHGTVAVTMGDDNRFPAGTTVTLPTVIGHRDVGLTDCPGAASGALVAVRDRAAQVAPYARGTIDSITVSGSTATVRGWTFDRRTTAPIDVAVEVNGGGRVTATAGRSRPDVDAVYPGAGANHGFLVDVTIPEGASTVCVGGLEASYGAFTPLGCVGASRPLVSPVGALSTVARVPNGMRVAGWGAEQQRAGPIEVVVSVDGSGVSRVTADRDDASAAAASGVVGSAHGFDVTVPATAGTHTFCATAINVGEGSDRALGCYSTAVPVDPWASFDVVAWFGSAAAVTGWAVDPDTAAGVTARLVIDGRPSVAMVADRAHGPFAWIPAAYGTSHGFSFGVPLSSTQGHFVCLGVDNVGAGSGSAPAVLDCRLLPPRPPGPAVRKRVRKPAAKTAGKTVRRSVRRR